MLLPPMEYPWKPHAHDMVLLTQNSNSSFISGATFKAPVGPQEQCCSRLQPLGVTEICKQHRSPSMGAVPQIRGVSPHLSTHSSIQPSPRHLFSDHQMPNSLRDEITTQGSSKVWPHSQQLAMCSSGIQGVSHSDLQRATWKHCCWSPEPLSVRGVLAHA